MLRLTLRTLAAPLPLGGDNQRSRRAERGACEGRTATGGCAGGAEEPEQERGEEEEGGEEEGGGEEGGERVPGWGRDCVGAVLPLLPQLLASATCGTTPLHLGALRCARAIFAAAGHEQPPQPPQPLPQPLPQPPSGASDAHGLLTAAPDGGGAAPWGGGATPWGGEATSARTRALREMREPSRLRAVADALHGPHVEVTQP